MSLIDRYEQHLEERVEADEITEVTKKTYLTYSCFILEALVGQIPVRVVQSYCEEWGALTDYRTVIRDLAELAKKRKEHTDELRRARGDL